MKNTIFRGAGVAIVTPMYANGAINFNKFSDIIEMQIAGKTDALIIAGTTGEASTLTDEEHVEIIRFAVEQTKGRVPVIAGTGSNDTQYAVDLTASAKKAGADATLQVTPYYNKTSQRGLVAHFEKIANEGGLPVILYNVPSRTGVNISLDAYNALAKHPMIVAAKEASGNISAIADLALACGDDLDIYSGNDDQILPILALGGSGVISVLSNVLPYETHEMCQSYFDGNAKRSTELQMQYLPLVHALFSDVNPIPVKEAMNLMGLDVGPCRLPLYPMTDAAREALRVELAKCGLVK